MIDKLKGQLFTENKLDGWADAAAAMKADVIAFVAIIISKLPAMFATKTSAT